MLRCHLSAVTVTLIRCQRDGERCSSRRCRGMLRCHGWSASARSRSISSISSWSSSSSSISSCSSCLSLATLLPEVGVATGQLWHRGRLPPSRRHRQLSVIPQEAADPRGRPQPGFGPRPPGPLFPAPAGSPSRGAWGSMDPALLIFLLYVMIAHELVCGWMQYRRQSAKPRKRAAGPLPYTSSKVCQGAWRPSSSSVRTIRGGRDLRKSGRIVRKA